MSHTKKINEQLKIKTLQELTSNYLRDFLSLNGIDRHFDPEILTELNISMLRMTDGNSTDIALFKNNLKDFFLAILPSDILIAQFDARFEEKFKISFDKLSSDIIEESMTYKTSDGNQSFIRHTVPGDGDCGYTAYGIKRADVLKLLKTNLANIKDIIQPLMNEALRTQPSLFNYLENQELLDLLKETQNTIDPLALEVAHYKIEEFVKNSADNLGLLAKYLDYDIAEKNIDHGWAHPAILQALAHIEGYTLNLWQLDATGNLIPNKLYATYSSPHANLDDNKVKHLLYVNSNHFDRLELKDVQHARHAAIAATVPPAQAQTNTTHTVLIKKINSTVIQNSIVANNGNSLTEDFVNTLNTALKNIQFMNQGARAQFGRWQQLFDSLNINKVDHLALYEYVQAEYIKNHVLPEARKIQEKKLVATTHNPTAGLVHRLETLKQIEEKIMLDTPDPAYSVSELKQQYKRVIDDLLLPSRDSSTKVPVFNILYEDKLVENEINRLVASNALPELNTKKPYTVVLHQLTTDRIIQLHKINNVASVPTKTAILAAELAPLTGDGLQPLSFWQLTYQKIRQFFGLSVDATDVNDKDALRSALYQLKGITIEPDDEPKPSFWSSVKAKLFGKTDADYQRLTEPSRPALTEGEEDLVATLFKINLLKRIENLASKQKSEKMRKFIITGIYNVINISNLKNDISAQTVKKGFQYIINLISLKTKEAISNENSLKKSKGATQPNPTSSKGEELTILWQEAFGIASKKDAQIESFKTMLIRADATKSLSIDKLKKLPHLNESLSYLNLDKLLSGTKKESAIEQPIQTFLSILTSEKSDYIHKLRAQGFLDSMLTDDQITQLQSSLEALVKLHKSPNTEPSKELPKAKTAQDPAAAQDSSAATVSNRSDKTDKTVHIKLNKPIIIAANPTPLHKTTLLNDIPAASSDLMHNYLKYADNLIRYAPYSDKAKSDLASLTQDNNQASFWVTQLQTVTSQQFPADLQPLVARIKQGIDNPETVMHNYLPTQVITQVMTTEEFKQKYKNLDALAHETSGLASPTAVNTLPKNGYIVSIVNHNADRKTHEGMFIEKNNPSSGYNITALSLPSELNKDNIINKALSTVTLDRKGLDDIAKQLNIYQKAIIEKADTTPATTALSTLIAAYIPGNNAAETDTLRDKLLESYTLSSVMHGLPSASYISFANKQIETFFARVGSDKTVYIKPNQDPLMIQAYELVCAAKGLKFKNESQLNYKLDTGVLTERQIDDVRRVRAFLNHQKSSMKIEAPTLNNKTQSIESIKDQLNEHMGKQIQSSKENVSEPPHVSP